ncbi:MAG: hypothetical protein CMJ46_11300 [Planctomyces sp.]|nr:hypothetical protein [Planctomyces sp.]
MRFTVDMEPCSINDNETERGTHFTCRSGSLFFLLFIHFERLLPALSPGKAWLARERIALLSMSRLTGGADDNSPV